MADRFDEMAREVLKKTLLYPNDPKLADVSCWDDLWDREREIYVAAIATALRELAAAEREAGAADMRERAAAKASSEGSAGSYTYRSAAGFIAIAIRSLPLTTPKKT